MPPPIHVFLTTIASQPALRQRQEYILRILQAKKIPFSSYDLASDADAKRLWRRKAPADKQQLPGILVGYQFAGTFAQFEEAVEYNELDTFLRRKEPWDPTFDEERPPPEVKPVGVPGANLPMEMAPEHIKKHIIAEQSSPLRVRSKTKPIPVNKIDETNHIDLGNELAGYGLQGVKVTQDELMDLMEQLGLGGEEADDLAKGLVGPSNSKNKKSKSPLSEAPEVEKADVPSGDAEKSKHKTAEPAPTAATKNDEEVKTAPTTEEIKVAGTTAKQPEEVKEETAVKEELNEDTKETGPAPVAAAEEIENK